MPSACLMRLTLSIERITEAWSMMIYTSVTPKFYRRMQIYWVRHLTQLLSVISMISSHRWEVYIWDERAQANLNQIQSLTFTSFWLERRGICLRLRNKFKYSRWFKKRWRFCHRIFTYIHYKKISWWLPHLFVFR